MSHPDDEILVDVAINGADAAIAPSSVNDHVRVCASCARTVTDLRRTLSYAGPSAADIGWTAPPASVWEHITAQIDNPAAHAVASGAEVIEAWPTAADLPRSHRRVSGHPASLAAPTPLESRRDRREREADRRPRLVGWAAGLAAAGLVVGLLTGRALWNGPTPPPAAAAQTTTAATTVSQIALKTLDAKDPKPVGEAAVLRTVGGYQLSIGTTKPVDAGDGYVEVWLINRDLKRMVSVGVLRGSGVASFPISQNLIDQGYVVVDISRQQFIDSTAHSGDSVMRGVLPA